MRTRTIDSSHHAFGNWHYSSIRMIDIVVDSITEPPKKTIKINFYNDIQKIQIYS